MNQRIFYTGILLSIVITLSSFRPLPMNIYRIEGSSEHDVRFQARRTIEKYDYEESKWSKLNLVPSQYDTNCYIQWDHWVANGLADRLGKPIAWKRNIQWNYECKDDKFMYVPPDMYSILLSRNPMAAYPKFTVSDKQILTDSGIQVSYKQEEYTFKVNGKSGIYYLTQYTFKVNDTYVFIEQVILDRVVDEKKIAEWVDSIADELKTVLE